MTKPLPKKENPLLKRAGRTNFLQPPRWIHLEAVRGSYGLKFAWISDKTRPHSEEEQLEDNMAAPERSQKRLPTTRVSQWMTRPVVTVKPLDTLRAARQLMAEHRINQLPVTKNDKLIGIVTDRDLRDAYPSSTQIYRSKGVDQFADSHTVQEVMTYNVISVTPDTSIEEAAALLRRHRIGALPVVEKGKMVGILTRSDILDFLLSEWNELP